MLNKLSLCVVVIILELWAIMGAEMGTASWP